MPYNLDAYEKGREAFETGLKENDYPSEYSKTQRQSWKAGYITAKEEEEKIEDQERWIEFSRDCPWHERNTGLCKALIGEDDDECAKGNCAPLYFKENHE